MRFWTTDRSYDDFFNRLLPSRTFVNKNMKKQPESKSSGPWTYRLHYLSRRSLRRAHPLLVSFCIEVVDQ